MNKDLKQGLAIGVAFAALVSLMPTKAEATESERCISSFHVDRIERKDNRTLIFHMRNGQMWTNELFSPLFGFDNDPLIFERGRPSTTQYCYMDRVGVLQRPYSVHMGNPFTSSLGYFVSIDGPGELPEGIE
jgi:hypothetical protein